MKSATGIQEDSCCNWMGDFTWYTEGYVVANWIEYLPPAPLGNGYVHGLMVFASGTGHPIRHDDLNSRCPTLVFAHETRQSLGIKVQIFLLADDDGEGVHY